MNRPTDGRRPCPARRHLLQPPGRATLLILVCLSTTAHPAHGADLSVIGAVKAGDLAAARALVRRGIDVNATEGDGMTALHWAAYRDDGEAVALLLAAGAAPNAVTRFGVTPLALASENRNAAIVRQLLDKGADPRGGPAGETPLHVAARSGAADVARHLLGGGAVVDARDSWQMVTPLMVAASERHPALVALLIAAGADVDAKAAETKLFIGPGDESTTYTQIPRGGMTALMYAARDGCRLCAALLADAGADVRHEDPARVTALNLAIYNGHYDTAALLLEKGADPNDGSVYLAVDMRNLVADGVNADHHPVPRSGDDLDSLDVLTLLLTRGGNPDHELLKELQSRYLGFTRPTYLSGLTPLQRAAQQADLASMRVLLDGGADPSLPGQVPVGGTGGVTPLLMAIRSLEGVPASTLGNRPGALAYRSRVPGDSFEAVKLLIDRGAQVNAADWAGATAVHGAALLGANDIIQLLVDHGASVEARNDEGKTALDLVSARSIEAGREDGRAAGKGTFEETAAFLRRLMSGGGNGRERDAKQP